MGLIQNISERLKGMDAKIVFPEGEDKRILQAVKTLNDEGIIHPIVLG